jgi:spore maturation protein CgeB
LKLFVVNYRFVFCGDVFTDGLRHAAVDLGLEYEGAYWDDADLPGKIERFHPDLIFVVHGRKFASRWGMRWGPRYPTAVWLVDEPYETDDTQRWSSCFDTVFVNDPSTLHRHRNAHYLPMCFDPHVHFDSGAERIYRVGFVGNWSPLRERYLSALADAGLLDYVVGDKWRTSELARYCPIGNIPSRATAELYQQTEIVINVFREKHHYNAQRIPATAMNPRIYEALACGAAVVSESREGIVGTFPRVPQFSTPAELVAIVTTLLADREALAVARYPVMSGNAYRDRLSMALQVCKVNEASYA